MKNTIRCCISCILPCGSLDVIRVVHTNGYVEEISGSIKASDIMRAHPKHVLKKPSSGDLSGALPGIVILPPDADLQRGKIYFLIPLPPDPDKTRSRSSTRKKKIRDPPRRNSVDDDKATLLLSDQYLSEILSEKVSSQRERRRGRVGVWRPHLQSICESPTDV